MNMHYLDLFIKVSLVAVILGAITGLGFLMHHDLWPKVRNTKWRWPFLIAATWAMLLMLAVIFHMIAQGIST